MKGNHGWAAYVVCRKLNESLHLRFFRLFPKPMGRFRLFTNGWKRRITGQVLMKFFCFYRSLKQRKLFTKLYRFGSGVSEEMRSEDNSLPPCGSIIFSTTGTHQKII